MRFILRVSIFSLMLSIGAIGNSLTMGIKKCDIAGIKGLIERNKIDVNQSNGNGVTSLHFASSLNSHRCPTDEIVKLLLAKGANPNARTVDGFTPLHITAYKGYFNLSKILIENGANPKISTNSGYTPLHQLIKGKDVNKKHMELLIKSGAEVDAKDKNGITPIHLIVGRVNSNGEPLVEELKYLIKSKGVDINVETVDKITPLEVAIRRSNTSDKYIAYIKILLERGANIKSSYINLAVKRSVKELLK